MKRYICLIFLAYGLCGLTGAKKSDAEPESGIFLIKTDSLGNVEWSKELKRGYHNHEDTMVYILKEDEISFYKCTQMQNLEIDIDMHKDTSFHIYYRSRGWGYKNWERGHLCGDSNRFYLKRFYRYCTDVHPGSVLKILNEEKNININLYDNYGVVEIWVDEGKVTGVSNFNIPLEVNAFFADANWTIDGNLLFIGSIISTKTKDTSLAENWDIWLVITDTLGDTLLTRTYDSGWDDFGYWIYPTADGGYTIFATQESSEGSNHDVCLFKIDAEGNIIWRQTYKGAADEVTGVWGGLQETMVMLFYTLY